MTLSMKKLEDLLKTNGFLIQRKFTIHGYAVYIEVFNINNAESFMLYIPSKYSIYVEDQNNTYKLKHIDIEDENIFKNLKEKSIDNFDVEKDYNGLNIRISPEKGDDLEKSLKENYDHEVMLKDLNKEDIDNLKDIFYQLSRLKLCVKHIKYKLSIIYKNYLCSIKKNNKIDCFIIKNFKNQKQKNIYVTIDLENMFKKISTIFMDINIVKTGINKILNENQIKHTQILNNILEQKNSIILSSEIIYKKKEEIINYLKKLQELLGQINEAERKCIEKIILLNENNKIIGSTITNDIQNSHEIHKTEKELENIQSVKEDIVKDIIKLRRKQENITLEIDKILFDNNVMINIINKNFNRLIESFD